MTADFVNVRRRNASLEDDLKAARVLANLLDAQFSFAGIRFGLDAIIGLIPVAGDFVTAVAACFPIHVARKHHLGKGLQARMGINVFVDWFLGSIPVIGDMFDVAFKANLRNLALLEKAAARAKTL